MTHGLPCDVCGTALQDLPGSNGWMWCRSCGTRLRHRGQPTQDLQTPIWSDPMAVASLAGSLKSHHDQIGLIINEMRRWHGDGVLPHELDRVILVLEEIHGDDGIADPVIDIPDPRADLTMFGTEDPRTMTAEDLRTTAGYLRAASHEEDAKAYEAAADVVASVEAMAAGGAEVKVIDGGATKPREGKL